MSLTQEQQNAEYESVLNAENNKNKYANAKETILHYLTNIKFNDDIVIKGYKNKDVKPIYDVTADRKTIFNLDTNTPKYLEFLQFMNTEFAKIYDEFQNNDGDIITLHLIDPTNDDDAKIVADYKTKYEKNFKPKTEDIKSDSYKNKKGDLYPHFESDMMSKTRKLQYEEIEEKMGITIPIQEQKPIVNFRKDFYK